MFNAILKLLSICVRRAINCCVVMTMCVVVTSSILTKRLGRRNALRHGAVDLHVTPRTVNFYPGRSVTVRCKAKASQKVMQWLDFDFYVSVDE